MRFFLAICLFFLALAGHAASAMVQDGIRANLRSGKGEEYRLVTVLPARTQVEVIGEEGGYIQVKTAEGQTGWLPARMLSVDKEEVAKGGNGTPGDLERLRGELRVAQAELARLQALQAQAVQATPAQGGERAWFWALIALAAGVALGMFLRERHYRKRLHGLRV